MLNMTPVQDQVGIKHDALFKVIILCKTLTIDVLYMDLQEPRVNVHRTQTKFGLLLQLCRTTWTSGLLGLLLQLELPGLLVNLDCFDYWSYIDYCSACTIGNTWASWTIETT